MGVLRVISSCGNDHVQWNEQGAQCGDEEANAAVRAAERIFAHECAGGSTAFRIEAGKPAERIEQFDLQAEQILLISGVVGG
jgi:hypothetical protein